MALATGCITTKYNSVTDLSPNYRSELTVLHPSFKVYNQSDTVSLLYFSVPTKDLLFAKTATSNLAEGKIALGYRLVSNFESQVILDSGSVSYTCNSSPLAITGTVALKTPGKGKYLLKLRVQELNRHVENFYYLDIDKTSEAVAQSYFVQKAGDSIHAVGIFEELVAQGQSYWINHPNSNALMVHYFKAEFPAAAPPQEIAVQKAFQYKPDSVFWLQADAQGQVHFSPSKVGLYHFISDTAKRDGLTLKCFASPFPTVNRVKDMLAPMRFIASKNELAQLTENKRTRAGIEKFWMNCGGTQDVAKELIKKYYNRVIEANKFFTSYLEGWKTDRGMIYIVFGPPTFVYRNNDSETWVYGDNSNANAINFNNPNNITFNFDHVPNPFSDNDYALERSVIYKQNWMNAVDNWRQGAVFFQN